MDDIGVKYFGEDNDRHLINSLKEDFAISEDWTGRLYCGINLKWYCDKLTLYISMSGYIRKQLQKYKFMHPQKTQYAPYPTTPRKYGATSQEPMPDDTPPSSTKEKSHISNKLSVASYIITYQ